MEQRSIRTIEPRNAWQATLFSFASVGLLAAGLVLATYSVSWANEQVFGTPIMACPVGGTAR